MQKNVASQKAQLFFFDATTGLPKTGDAANLTAYISKDGGAVTVLGDTTATEMDATNAKGWYQFDLTQAETNGDELLLTGKSSTANVTTGGRMFSTVPASFTAFVTPTGAAVNTTQLAGATVAATTSVTFPAASTVATTTGAVGSVTGAVGSVTGAVGSVTGNVGGNVTGSVGSVAGAVASVTGNVGGNVVGSVGSVAGAVGSVTGNVGGNVVGSVASVTAGVTVTTNNDKTGYSIASGGIGSGAHAAAELNAIADALLDRNMATGTDNGTNSTAVRTVRQALRRMRNKESIAAGTLTVTKEDDSTTSWTAAVTTTAGDPLSAVDPT